MKSSKARVRIGPYSRVLRRGVIANTIDGRSTIGRFARDLERQLSDHCGGSPSVTQRMQIDRAVKIRIQLDMLDAKLQAGDWTPHDQRTYGGLLNAYRLTVRELGMAPKEVKQPSLIEQLLAEREASA